MAVDSNINKLGSKQALVNCIILAIIRILIKFHLAIWNFFLEVTDTKRRWRFGSNLSIINVIYHCYFTTIVIALYYSIQKYPLSFLIIRVYTWCLSFFRDRNVIYTTFLLCGFWRLFMGEFYANNIT